MSKPRGNTRPPAGHLPCVAQRSLECLQTMKPTGYVSKDGVPVSIFATPRKEED